MENAQNSVKTIDRALKILDCFTRETPRLSLVEIAKMIDLSPSTTSRIIATLENGNFLERNPDTLLYSLGYKFVRMGSIVLQQNGLRDVARPYLIQLRDFYNETVGLDILNQSQRICIDCVNSTQPIRRVLEIETKKDLTRGAPGKLLLAYQPDDFIRRIFLESPSNPLTFDELMCIREAGFALSWDENKLGIASVAAPIFNADGRIEAALYIGAVASRTSPEKLDAMALKTRELALSISERIGYHPH